MTIERIILKNFKCFEALDLRMAPLTLLCGLNGMGKSTVIQAVLAWHGSRQENRLHVGGGLDLGLGSGRDLLYDESTSDTVEIGIGMPWASRLFMYRYVLKEDGDLLLRGEGPDRTDGPPSDQGDDHGGLIYVNAERIGPRRTHPHSHLALGIGERGEYTLSYINRHASDLLPVADPRRDGMSSRTVRETLTRWLQEVSPGARLEFDIRDDADTVIAGFTFDREGDVHSRRYRTTNVGFGLSYVLPVLVGLLTPRGTLCLIENPEAHLHPRGQAKLAELAVRASLAGVQVIVETHSDHFMDGVRVAVREGLTRPADVVFHYFERPGGKKSVVETPTIDEDGRLSHWPTGFFDQHDETLSRLLRPK